MSNDANDYQEELAPNNAWNLYLGHDICTSIEQGLNHEWLVTNGLGGYACGTIIGATTRSYHGLLVAAIRPPVERFVMVTKIDEEVELSSEPGHTEHYKLGTNEYQDGTIEPQGYKLLDSFSLKGDIACFTYRLKADVLLEKRVWMEYAQNTTYVRYELRPLDSEQEIEAAALNLYPFCLYRDHHSTTQGSGDWHFTVENLGNKCRVRANEQAHNCWLIAGTTASYSPTGYWYWHVLHRRDRERGLPESEDVYQPGIFHLHLKPLVPVTLVISAEEQILAEFGSEKHEEAAQQAYQRHQRRTRQLLNIADRSTVHLAKKDPVFARLAIAADQFIVVRPEADHIDTLKLAPDRKTVIAGYPWFTDWGRDSMISLPGLLLCTGRYSEARGLLKAFASYMHQGLIPNRFPDHGEAPEYNTADATLWMFHALNSYTSTTGDWSLVKELYPLLSESIQWYMRGTLYGICVDPQDGLLQEGAPGLQLTWMDAKVDDWVVTPRQGKPVEVNALWYHALTCMENWAKRLSYDALEYAQLRMQVLENFARRYWYEEGGYLYDVIDVDGVAGQNDSSLRPNQLFAASLTSHLLTEEQTRSILEQVTEHLLTPMGLRTLSPQDPNYHSHFNGNRQERDSAYHQGTVWPWLIGAYVDVHLRLHNDCLALLPLLQPLVRHLWDDCVGSICEVAEPEPPYTPAGCFAQAWSVAELLRAWLAVAG
ncbi:MAG TPA: amylo-alpha-1,6-glucosidase [Ktedonobacteraceae bacterium]|jgi:predicted glycogen debranching enzyme|nr:amylo-alpha-1,6-glucosidase [Ktedonobacteraceae bacterium]